MKKKILVCDDDEGLRAALAMALSGAYDVVQADGGAQALRLVEAEKPALVFLDVSMPGMTGLEVLKTLRRTHPSISVIMLSGKKELGVVRRALALGAKSYVTKPFDEETVKKEAALILQEPAERDISGRPWRVQVGGTA